MVDGRMILKADEEFNLPMCPLTGSANLPLQKISRAFGIEEEMLTLVL